MHSNSTNTLPINIHDSVLANRKKWFKYLCYSLGLIGITSTGFAWQWDIVSTLQFKVSMIIFVAATITHFVRPHPRLFATLGGILPVALVGWTAAINSTLNLDLGIGIAMGGFIIIYTLDIIDKKLIAMSENNVDIHDQNLAKAIS